MNKKKTLHRLNAMKSRLLRLHFSLGVLLLCGFMLAGTIYSFATPPFRAPDEPAHWDAAVRRMAGVETLGEHCSKALSLFSFLRLKNLIHGERIETGKYMQLDTMQQKCIGPHIWSGNALTYYGYALADTFMRKLVSYRYQLTEPSRAMISYFTARFLQGVLVVLLLARMLWLSRGSFQSAIGNIWIAGLSLTPLFIQQTFSISADCIILTAAVAAVNVVTSLPRMRTADALIALFLFYNAMIAKPTYAPAFGMWALMIFLAAHLRAGTADGLKERALRAINPLKSGATAFLYATAALTVIVGIQYVTLEKPPLFTPSPDVDPGKQLAFIKENLQTGLATVRAGIMSFYTPVDFWVPLGWFDFPPGDFTRSYWTKIYTSAIKIEKLTAYGLLAVFLFSLRREWWPKIKQALPSLIACAAGAAGIYLAAFAASLSMYLYWTPVGKANVDGMQVRYFFPLLIMAIGLARMLALGIMPDQSVKPVEAVKSENQAVSPSVTRGINALWILALTLVGFHVLIFIVSLAFDTVKRYY